MFFHLRCCGISETDNKFYFNKKSRHPPCTVFEQVSNLLHLTHVWSLKQQMCSMFFKNFIWYLGAHLLCISTSERVLRMRFAGQNFFFSAKTTFCVILFYFLHYFYTKKYILWLKRGLPAFRCYSIFIQYCTSTIPRPVKEIVKNKP